MRMRHTPSNSYEEYDYPDMRRSTRYDRMPEYDMHHRTGHNSYSREHVGFGEMSEYSCLADEELEDLVHRFYGKMEEQYRKHFTRDNIRQNAELKGISFDKFTFEELYVVTLMLFADYFRSLGFNNVVLYICLAKQWLCDDDAALRYGEKLAAYYDYIIMGEDR